MVHRCEFLKKCPFLDPLSNEQIGKLAGALESCSFESDDYIIRQGDIGDCFYIIEEGQVKCTQMKSSGREVELLYGLSPPSLPSSPHLSAEHFAPETISERWPSCWTKPAMPIVSQLERLSA
jgi:CRP-like cAMP-binding protein